MSVLPFRGIHQPVGKTLTTVMNFLVQDQDHLLARDLIDKRAGLLCAGSVKQSRVPGLMLRSLIHLELGFVEDGDKDLVSLF